MRISFRQIFASLLILTLYAGGLRIVFRPDSASAASAPNIVGYQGRVLNANGVPVSDASATMIFRLYDADTAGTCLWSNSSTSCASATGMSVTLTDGMFAVQLGDTGSSFAAIPDTVFSDNATVYLQVTIGGETLSPRTRLTAAPYAMNSDTLDGVDSTGFVNTTTGCTDCLDFTSLTDTLALDASTSITNGTSTLSMNLDNTGEFIIKDNGTAFATFKGTDSAGGAAQIYLRPNGTPDLVGNPSMGPFLWLDARDVTTAGMGVVWLHAPNLTSGTALNITQDLSFAAYGLGGTEPATADNDLVAILRNFDDANSVVSGTLLKVTNSDQGVDPTADSTTIAQFRQLNPNGSGISLDIEQSGSGAGLRVTNTGTGTSASISSTNASSSALYLSGQGNGSATVLHATGSGSSRVAAFVSSYTGVGGSSAVNIETAGDVAAISTIGTGVATTASMVNITGNAANYGLQIWNAGNSDTRQGIYLIGCKDSNPTSACDYVTFATGATGQLGAIEGNGAGGVAYASPGSDYAELFPGDDSMFGQGYAIALDGNGSVKLASAGDTLLGAYSVAPNTLGNWRDGWKESGIWVPVALLGQVPVRVSDAGGPIAIGDYLMVGDIPGTLVRATVSGHTVGQALEAWGAGTGTIQAFIRPSWHDVSGAALLGSAASGASSDVDTLAPEASVINLAGAHLTNVASITGLSGAWEITEDGNIRIRGRFTEITRGHNGTDVETHGITSLDTLVQLSGSAHIQEGLAVIKFNDVDPKFAQVISPSAAYRVLVTPRDNVGNVYVSQSDNQGFTLSASSGGAGTVDYLVIAYNKDFEPENAAVPPPAEPVIGSSSNVPVDAPVDAPAPDPVVTPDPAPSDAPVDAPAPDPVPTDAPVDAPDLTPAPEPVPEPVPTP